MMTILNHTGFLTTCYCFICNIQYLLKLAFLDKDSNLKRRGWSYFIHQFIKALTCEHCRRP